MKGRPRENRRQKSCTEKNWEHIKHCDQIMKKKQYAWTNSNFNVLGLTPSRNICRLYTYETYMLLLWLSARNSAESLQYALTREPWYCCWNFYISLSDHLFCRPDHGAILMEKWRICHSWIPTNQRLIIWGVTPSLGVGQCCHC